MCKLPIHIKGAECNLLERERWRHRHKLDIDRWLCPVLACADDGSWLVMQRAEIDHNEKRVPQHPPAVRKLKDTGAKNWGRLAGQPVLVDYGYPEPQ